MIKRIWFFAIDFFSLILNPARLPVCRYEPSCSVYAKSSFGIHGIWKGFWLTASRLFRCRPFGRFGFDPVPPPTHPKGR